jgi:uncharacterized protein YecT (DUF1311 family)
MKQISIPALIYAAIMALMFTAGSARALDCNRDDLDQTSMNKCAYQGWQAADAELNRAYRKARAATKIMDGYYVPEGEKTATLLLRDAQRTWITFRDQACIVESAAMRGGTAQALLQWGCMERLTRNRIFDLQVIADMNV